MQQAGAKFIAEDRGAFDSERGGGTAAQTASADRQISAAAPLAYRAEMDAETIAVLAGICRVSVEDFEKRYGAGAAGVR